MRLPAKTAAMAAPSMVGKTVGTGSTEGGPSEARDWNRDRIEIRPCGQWPKLAQEKMMGKWIAMQIVAGLIAVAIGEIAGEVGLKLSVVGMDSGAEGGFGGVA